MFTVETQMSSYDIDFHPDPDSGFNSLYRANFSIHALRKSQKKITMAKICLLAATRQTMLLIPDHLPKPATYWLFIGYLLAIYGRTSTSPQGTHEAAVTR